MNLNLTNLKNKKAISTWCLAPLKKNIEKITVTTIHQKSFFSYRDVIVIIS